MSNSGNAPRDVDALLVEAGAEWRRRQDFRELPLSVEQRAKRPRGLGTFANAFGGIVGLVATAALAMAILIAGPVGQRLGVGGDNSASAAPSAQTSSIPAATATMALSPAGLEAAQLTVIEAVNADPANFAGVYLENDGSLVIQYVGSNAGRSKVEPTITPGLSVRWEKVDYNQSRLSQIASEIRALNLKDVFSVSAGTNRNLVIVSVDPNGSVSEISQILAKYGDAVLVEFSSGIPVVEPAATLVVP